MATVYSLICWGGYAGKAITSFNATTNVITLADHGLHTGTPVSPTTTVSGVTAGTVYYPRWISASTFTLHPTAADATANTNIVDLTGSTTFTLQSAAVATPSTALASYGLSDLSRWDAGGGSYRIYAGIPAWLSGRASPGALDEEVAEFVDAFTEFKSSGAMSVNLACAAIRMESKVNGIRSAAFHGGRPSMAAGNGTEFGYVMDISGSMGSGAALTLATYNTVVDGLTFRQTSSYGVSTLMSNAKAGNVVRNCIFKGYSNSTGECIYVGAALSVIEYNLCLYGSIGIEIANNQAGVRVRNNIVSRAGTGFYGGSSLYGFYYNNIAAGNTTDWNSATLTYVEGAGYNARAAGSAWYKGTDTSISMATTDFLDYANHDYSPATSSSPQVDAGVTLYGSRESDIADDLVPSYDGSSMATSIVDVGCFEFDLGNGPPPASQDYTVTGVTLGRIKIAKQSDGSEIYNSTTLPSAEPSTFSTDTPVYIYIRKGSSAPYYHPLKIAATIDVDAGLAYDATGLQQEDIAAHDYTGTAVASDWSFNLSTGAITHDSGSTRYSVQDLYSWHQDYTDGSTQVDDDPLMHGTTPTIFELINGGDISDSDLQDLYGGSIEFEDGTLWANIWTTDTMAAAHDVYLVQDGAKVTDFWASGPIDVLVKVIDAGTLIDSGLVDAYVRPYGYSYAYYQVDASGGGRNVAPLSTLADETTTDINAATAATYSDVGFTFGSTSQDLGEGGGAATYYCRIDCAGRTLDQVFARCQYVTRDASTTTLNSLEGWRYRKAHGSYVANDQYPFGRYAAGFWTVARGVWLDNVATSDQYSYQLTDHAGTTHQLMPPLNQSVALSGLDPTWRVQLYDTDAAAELYNDVPGATTLLWVDPSAPADDRPIRLRVMSTTNGDGSAIEMIDTAIGVCGTTESTIALSYLVSASEDVVDTANGIDGSTISGITINDGAMILEIDSGTVTSIGGVDVVQVDLKDLYAYETYWLGTEDGIRDEARFISAVDPANYEFVDFKLRNDTGYPVVIVGGYARDAATNSSASLTDYAGGAIHYAPDHVVNNIVTVGGANIITGDVADVLAAIPSASTIADTLLNTTYP